MLKKKKDNNQSREVIVHLNVRSKTMKLLDHKHRDYLHDV